MGRKTEFKIDIKLSDIKIKKMSVDKNGDYHIYVSCDAKSAKCHKCKRVITKSHGQCKETIIEDLPIMDNQVFLHVKWPRFICTDCDENVTTSFRPDWLNETGILTKRYENYMLKNLINSTMKDVAEKFSTTEEVIEGVVNRNITTSIDWRKISISRMGVDEIALRKGHNHYLTIVSDLSTPKKIKILAVLDGRKKEEISPFFSSIPRHIWENLESVTIDMGASYFSTLKDYINNERAFNRLVTIDRFHVAKLLGEKVDKERKLELKKLKEEFKDDDVKMEKIKSTMWPFRHHFDDLGDEEKLKLGGLFELSPKLKECYELREELYHIFEMDLTKETAKIMIDAWCIMALSYSANNDRKNPFESFVKTYYNFQENILNYFIFRHTSGAVEGVNNKIKVIKRRGFGFRNVLNFTKRLFLDINLKNIYIPVSA